MVVLRRTGKEPGVINNIKSRKLKYFGRMPRGEKYQLLCLILQEKRSRRRPRTIWQYNLRELDQVRFQYISELYNATKNKRRIAVTVSNLLQIINIKKKQDDEICRTKYQCISYFNLQFFKTHFVLNQCGTRPIRKNNSNAYKSQRYSQTFCVLNRLKF